MIFTSLCCLVLNPSDLASGMLSVLLLCLFVYYLSLHNNWHGVREDGITRADVIRILEESGLGLPTYTLWGRTRSGCFFCFYQQKVEWVRLKQNHPDLFEEAKRYEYANTVNGEAFYWNRDESLEELERPERMEQIIQNWEKNRERMRAKRNNKTLLNILGGMDEEEEEEREGCLICSI